MSKIDDTTVGVKSFYRPQKVRMCLESIANSENEFSEVIVVDDGPINRKKERIYDYYRDIVEVKVIDLDFDSGVTKSRNVLVNETDTEYLLLMDDDMQLAKNFEILLDIMRNSDLGGISGILSEQDGLRASAHDIEFRRNTLTRCLRDDEKQYICGEEVKIFDFIPYCGVFLTEMLKRNQWDPNYTISKEHIDYFTHHRLNTDWKFGICEKVKFPHRPGGEIEFEQHRNSEAKRKSGLEYFLNKYDLSGIARIETYSPEARSMGRVVKTLIKKMVPPELVSEIQRRRILKRNYFD